MDSELGPGRLSGPLIASGGNGQINPVQDRTERWIGEHSRQTYLQTPRMPILTAIHDEPVNDSV